MKLTLETERLLLRPWTEDDAEAMYDGWAHDEEVTKFLTWNPHPNILTTEVLIKAWIKEYEKLERINCAIVLKSENKLIGGIDVVGYLDGIPVIGYCSDKRYWNRGYMTEACKCLLDYLFSIGHKEVKIDAIKENIGSNRVIQKCGGVLIKTEEEFQPLKGYTATINRYVVKAK